MRHRRSLWLVLGALLLLLAVLAPGFFAPSHLASLLLDHAPLLVASLGMTLLIAAGQIDVAVGAGFAACAVAAGACARAGAPLPVWVTAALGTGALLGLLHALLVVRLGIPALVATLATLAILRGALRLLTGGVWIQELPAGFQWCGLGQQQGQWVYPAVAFGLAALVAVFLRHAAAGRALLAVGCDPEAARRLGVRSGRAITGVFVASGVLAAVAALLDQTRHPAVAIEAGTGLELATIACAVLGGTKVRGGRASILGTALAVLLFAALSGLVFLRVDAVWERAVQGAVLLAAVARQAGGQAARVRSHA
jgi:ribose/xylose/arabinose/galactoside ABC-type transport system permease subunit